MTDLKTLFPTEVKQPKLGVVWWATALGEAYARPQPYREAGLAVKALNKMFTHHKVHYWLEPVL